MKKAFTLMELMIAISIFFTLSYLSYVSIESTFALSSDVKTEEDYTTDIIRVISRMKREMSNAFLIKKVKEDSRVKTIFKSSKEFDIDKITFTSFSHLRVNFNSKESDQTEISYFGRKHDRDDNARGYKLMKRESFFIDDKPEKGGVIREIARNVKSFHCKYYKNNSGEESWVDVWDTNGIENGNKLPEYIRCKISFYPPIDEDRDPETYMFEVKVTLTEGLE
jgi:general secretion pathway protein J